MQQDESRQDNSCSLMPKQLKTVFLVQGDACPKDTPLLDNSKLKTFQVRPALKMLKMMFGDGKLTTELIKLTLKQIYSTNADRDGLDFSGLCQLLAIKVFRKGHIALSEQININNPSRKDIHLIKKFTVQYE